MNRSERGEASRSQPIAGQQAGALSANARGEQRVSSSSGCKPREASSSYPSVAFESRSYGRGWRLPVPEARGPPKNPGTRSRPSTSTSCRQSTTMSKPPDEQRLELLQGTLDMLILRTLQWGSQHGHGIGQAIRTQSDDLLKGRDRLPVSGASPPRKTRMAEVPVGRERGQPASEVLPADGRGKAQLLRERDRWSQLVNAIGRIMNPAPAAEE